MNWESSLRIPRKLSAIRLDTRKCVCHNGGHGMGFTEGITMTRDDIIHILQQHMPEMRRFGVAYLGVFGSYARGEERPDSDIDILVDFDRPVSIFKYLDVKEYLENVLGRSVDLVTRAALRTPLRERILTEAFSAT